MLPENFGYDAEWFQGVFLSSCRRGNYHEIIESVYTRKHLHKYNLYEEIGR